MTLTDWLTVANVLALVGVVAHTSRAFGRIEGVVQQLAATVGVLQSK